MEMSFEDKNISRLVSDDLIIGRGSVGDVYGPCKWEGKECAIKKRWHIEENPEKELTTLCTMMKLHHNNLIKVYGVSLETRALYVMMEYASGGSLKDVLSKRTSDFPVEIVSEWGIQIADGMAYLHDEKIVHRDLKSRNIVIMESDASSNPYKKTLRIIDFDLIREFDCTKTMTMAGTYAWMAPEVLNKDLFSKASDVWSYGIVLWEILTRKVPYKGVPERTIMQYAREGQMKLEISDTFPDTIKYILKKCLSIDKNERPSFQEILLLQRKEKKMMSSDAIITHRAFLEDRMDPDFGLLDKILSRKMIEGKEIEDVANESTTWKRNSRLLNYILARYQSDALLVALRDADQKHIANYLTANGEYSARFGEEWPLTTKEMSVLIINHDSLVDLLDVSELLSLLYSTNVINRRQKETISSEPASHKKNLMLLDIMRRRSLRDYKQTINCLYMSQQGIIAGILNIGGDEETNRKDRTGRQFENVGEIEDWMNKQLNVSGTEYDQPPLKTVLYVLPLEILDIILEKSHLHWILNSSLHQKDEHVIKTLASVDVCWFKRITRQRFKRRIWRRLKDFYERNNIRSAIVRNNQRYLLENIQPNDKFYASMLSFDCITDKQRRLIRRQRSDYKKTKANEQSRLIQWHNSQQDANSELVCLSRSFDQTKFSNFSRCLRRNNQNEMARTIENGGVVIKVELEYRDAMGTIEQFHHTFENLRKRAMPRSHRTDILISQLKDEGVEILNSQLDRQTVIVWIWCRSQAALGYVQKMYESNQLTDIFDGLAYITRLASEIIQWTVINIDRSEIKKTVVNFMISMNFTQRIDVEIDEDVHGVTKLGNEIYVLCRLSGHRHTIRVFEDQNPFGQKKDIKKNEIKYPEDIGSSQKENCIYVSDIMSGCKIWKITKEADDEHKIINWLSINYTPLTLSVSSDGEVLVVDRSSFILNIYASDAELILSIQLERAALKPIHAMKTSIGHFIILYRRICEEREMDTKMDLMGLSNDERGWKNTKETWWFIYELTEDGQTILRRFVPSNESQTLHYPLYLSLDSEDRVIVADENWRNESRIIQFDSDLKWHRILCSTKQKEETSIDLPCRLYYDEEKEQLIVGGRRLSDSRGGLGVYTMIRY